MRLSFITVVALCACSSSPKPDPVAKPGAAGSADPVEKPSADPDPATAPKHAKASKMEWAPQTLTLSQAGVIATWMDPSVNACDDFFAYACGKFTKTAKIPGDRWQWGAIEMLEKSNEDLLHQLLDDAAAKPGTDPVLTKLGAYYAACTDEGAIEKAGVAPLTPILDEIAKVTDAKSAARAVIALHVAQVPVFFDLGPTQDYADATKVIAGLDQAGLGMPDRKYYLESTGNIAKTRETYRAHVVRLFQLVGKSEKEAKAAAEHAYSVELALAKAQQDEVARRDPHAIYHRVERDGLEKRIAPSFPWGDYLGALGLADVTAITVNEPGYCTAVGKLLQTTPAATLRDYMTAALLRSRSKFLGKAWTDEAFVMDKVLNGVQEQPPRWRRCVERADRDLGELLGQLYVKQKFGSDAKQRAIELTREVLASMRVELDSLAWMDEPTRTAAKQKLEKMAYLVGYPDSWRKYDFEIARDSYAANVLRAQQWEARRQYAKIGKPVDRFDWEMTPPTVNAYYEPTLNELALPAGQLQPPMFSPTAHPAVNFGAMGGGTIGHEMTHGFDDEGSQFDADGNLRDWWSKDTKDKFATATKCVQDQYSQYDAVPGVKLNGKLTSGENIADIGGVKLGYEAYKAWRAKQKAPVQRQIEGFTDDQIYFLSYAQSWCEVTTPAKLESNAHTNPHSPPKWRVNGVIVDQPGFAAAFSCPASTKMNPGNACSVW